MCKDGGIARLLGRKHTGEERVYTDCCTAAAWNAMPELLLCVVNCVGFTSQQQQCTAAVVVAGDRGTVCLFV